MDLTFRTLGPWGPGKGSNLQAPEVDFNFWELATAILNLQNDPSLPNGIATISIVGTQMTITLMNGDVMGPFTIPILTFHWRGEWTPNTHYGELDTFTVTNTGIFVVEFPHLSGADFDPNIQVAGEPALVQLFGSADARLSTLPDVEILGTLVGGEILSWVASTQKWTSILSGSMAFQDSDAVTITGGLITGMSPPFHDEDVATKAYVDGVVIGGASIPSITLLGNIGAGPAPASPTLLSDFLDAALGTTVTGTIITRSGFGWAALPAGASGYVLQANGAGVDIAWVASPGQGVVSIVAGTGITTGGAPITSTGTVSLASIADGGFLANIGGVTQAPTPVTVSQFLDHVLTASRGTLLTRTIAGWVGLAPGTTGLYLKTQGSGSDLMWDAPPGAGTVLSVATGTGLTGGPITSTGTVSLAAVADNNLLANTSGASAAPVATTVSALLDRVLGSAQGDVVFRSATAWTALAPGTSGQILTTAGAAANPSWANPPITGSSTPNNRIIANISGSSAIPTGVTLSAILDAILSSARGSMIFRTNSGWTALAPGASGQVLQTGGASGDPSWAANAGGLIAITSPQPEDVLLYNSSSGKFENRRAKYNIGAYVGGSMTPAQNLLFHKFSRAVTLPANLGPYLGHATEAGAGTAATASTAITLSRAVAATPTTFTTVATITFGASGVTGSFSAQGAILFAQGDILRVRGPTIADATLADFHLTLVGFET